MVAGVPALIQRAVVALMVAALGGVGCGGTVQKTPVRLRLWLSGDVVGEFRAAIGHDVTISLAGQSLVQLTPSLDRRSLALRVRRGSDVPGAPRNAADRALRLERSRPVSIPEASLAIEWLRDDGNPQDGLPAQPCSRCCVSCAGVSICACSVRMACGSCTCDGGCASTQRSGLGPPPTSTRSNSGGHSRASFDVAADTQVQLVPHRPGARR
jgi:hypothetical protein